MGTLDAVSNPGTVSSAVSSTACHTWTRSIRGSVQWPVLWACHGGPLGLHCLSWGVLTGLALSWYKKRSPVQYYSSGSSDARCSKSASALPSVLQPFLLTFSSFLWHSSAPPHLFLLSSQPASLPLNSSSAPLYLTCSKWWEYASSWPSTHWLFRSIQWGEGKLFSYEHVCLSPKTPYYWLWLLVMFMDWQL